MTIPSQQQAGGISDASPQLVVLQQLVPGGSLSSVLERFGPLPPSLARNYISQILRGLAYLHANGIVHRDIKGANVLVDDRGGVRLADFGASKRVLAGDDGSDNDNDGEGEGNELTLKANTVRGTPFFMAPEVMTQQHSYGRRADVWSVGCTLFQCLTAESPWRVFEISSIYLLMRIVVGSTGVPPLGAADMPAFITSMREFQPPPGDEAAAAVASAVPVDSIVPRSMQASCRGPSRERPLLASLPETLQSFLRACFERNPTARPLARELLQHPFIAAVSDDELDATVAHRPTSELPAPPAPLPLEPFEALDPFEALEPAVATPRSDQTEGIAANTTLLVEDILNDFDRLCAAAQEQEEGSSPAAAVLEPGQFFCAKCRRNVTGVVISGNNYCEDCGMRQGATDTRCAETTVVNVTRQFAPPQHGLGASTATARRSGTLTTKRR